MNSKISSLLADYALTPSNKNAGSGKGGHAQRFIFLLGKKHVEDVKDSIITNLTFDGNYALWNTEWLDNSTLAQVRDVVDSKLDALNIDSLKSENSANINIDPETITAGVKEMDPSLVCAGGTVDMTNLTSLDKLVIAMRVAAEYTKQLDAGLVRQVDDSKVADVLANVESFEAEAAGSKEAVSFATFMSQLEPAIVLFAMRTQIGLDRIVRLGLDETPAMSELMVKISNAAR